MRAEGGEVQEKEGKGSDRGHHMLFRDLEEARMVSDEPAEARRDQFLKAL